MRTLALLWVPRQSIFRVIKVSHAADIHMWVMGPACTGAGDLFEAIRDPIICVVSETDTGNQKENAWGVNIVI